ncbi:ArsR family transcriptional regulator [Paenibacillus mucilaginosus 3016]|uniref:DNA topoisomerase (ATP-hydrolyzing) n=1 Tax=Paenibacillus mucilaginosus 3016 TaxID=1116391 RepID=H6NE69_9BACL|nr:helix-turn-helix domain-containing protein [Paenibacillus mucilaginosus]AFC33845.1 ArsR family transcriptional regulator [Paenibacillus mucilaginosus 3016]WFA22229.1 ArsR family transcriptional regulator [Paenibacillus mucilaginosus]
MVRDVEAELDALKLQLEDLQRVVGQMGADRTERRTVIESDRAEAGEGPERSLPGGTDAGSLHYSGAYRIGEEAFRWEPRERRVEELFGLDAEKAARILGAIGHKQRLDILRTVLQEPRTGGELVERLNMGTTGQLYHHIKALLGADLLVQEERGGRYAVPAHRRLPLLLLLAASADLLDASRYVEMTEARGHAGFYLGGIQAGQGYDPHPLIWALLENAAAEHRAGYSTEVRLFLHDDGSVTVADNGRGIPVRPLGAAGPAEVQTLLTELGQPSRSAVYEAPGADKEISPAVVNALSQRLTVEIRRDGNIYRQEYRYGVPQTGLLTVGATGETGTSITLLPDPELFGIRLQRDRLEERARSLAGACPGLQITVG